MIFFGFQNFALNELTIGDSKTLLVGYTRFKHDSKFIEEMLFCKSLKTTTTARGIHAVVKEYFTENGIPISYLVSVTADVASAMMGKRNKVPKLKKTTIQAGW